MKGPDSMKSLSYAGVMNIVLTVIALTSVTLMPAEANEVFKNYNKMLYKNFVEYKLHHPTVKRNQPMNLKPVIINGQEYVLYKGAYIPVDNE